MRTSPLTAALLLLVALTACGTSSTPPPPSAAPATSTACAADDAVVDEAAPVVTPSTLCAADGEPWRASAFQSIVEMPGDPDRDAICDGEQDAFYAAIEPARASALTLEVATGDASSDGTIAVAAFASGGRDAVAALDAFVEACAPPSGTWEPLSVDGWTGIEASLTSDDDFDAGRTYWIAVDDRFAVVQALPTRGRPLASLEAHVATVLAEQLRLLES